MEKEPYYTSQDIMNILSNPGPGLQALGQQILQSNNDYMAKVGAILGVKVIRSAVYDAGWQSELKKQVLAYLERSTEDYHRVLHRRRNVSNDINSDLSTLSLELTELSKNLTQCLVILTKEQSSREKSNVFKIINASLSRRIENVIDKKSSNLSTNPKHSLLATIEGLQELETACTIQIELEEKITNGENVEIIARDQFVKDIAIIFFLVFGKTPKAINEATTNGFTDEGAFLHFCKKIFLILGEQITNKEIIQTCERLKIHTLFTNE